MALGDDATNAGMDVVLPEEDRRNGADELTKTRDYVAQFFRAAKAYVDTKVGAISLAWNSITGKPSTFPPSSHSHAFSSITSRPSTYPPAAHTHTSLDVSGRRLGTGDDVGGTPGWITGQPLAASQFYSTGAYAATSGYTVCYINHDGRISRGASARRYKKHISDIDALTLGDIFPPLVRYQMKNGDGDWKLGHIADDLAGTDAARFAVVINSEVESIDFIQLLLAQVAQLNARLKAVEDRER